MPVDTAISKLGNVSAVTRAMMVLETLAGERQGMTLSEIHARVGAPLSALSKIMSTLLRDGYIQQNDDGRRFMLAVKIISLGQRHLDQLEFADVYGPILQKLAEELGELVQLSVVVRGAELIYIAKVEGVHSLRVASRLGQKVEVHANAAGKAWLASLEQTKAVGLALKEDGLRRFTEKTITSVTEFLSELEKTAKRGYGINEEEYIPGVVGIAAPVRVRGMVAATVGVAVPSSRATPEVRRFVAERTVAAADELSLMWPESMEILIGTS